MNITVLNNILERNKLKDNILQFVENFYNNTNDQFLFNGNHLTDLSFFNKFIKDHNYKFKSEGNTVGGYLILRNKKNSLIMDVGSPPEKKYSAEYQSGALSIEIVHEGENFSGVVTRIIPIGAFVKILPGKEGMEHISQ